MINGKTMKICSGIAKSSNLTVSCTCIKTLIYYMQLNSGSYKEGDFDTLKAMQRR